MKNVEIKDIKRKTTIPLSEIRKAAAFAYGTGKRPKMPAKPTSSGKRN